MLIFTILPIVVMFVLLYLVIKWAVSSTFRDVFTADRSAREILDELYARGEYEQMRRDIQAE